MPRGIFRYPEERIKKIKAYQAKRWFKEPAQKVCEICGKVFYQSKDERNHQWEKKRFCSLICKGIASRGVKIHTEKHKEELRKEMKGNTRGFVEGKPSPRKGRKLGSPSIAKKRVKKPKRIKKAKEIKTPPKAINAWHLSRILTEQEEKHRIRISPEMVSWRNTVFARDNYLCQKYKTKEKKLQAHHINNFADYPELRFDVDNGITLSYKAHREFHKKYGIKNNTRKQIEDFLKN